jgi:DNA-binding MarR family transcriptional regulator
MTLRNPAATSSSAVPRPAGETADFDLERYVPFLLNRGATRIAVDFGASLKAHGLNITIWRLLASLNQHASQRIGEIAEFTGIELWTVSRVASRLEQDGLVARQRGDDDARGVIVSLTPAGRTLVEALIPEARHYEAVILEGLSADEAQSLRGLLERVFANMRR